MLSGASLLLLEDEPLLRKRLAAQLGRRGLEVTAVGTLAEARAALADLAFDFALFDVNLPDGRSIELLQARSVPASCVAIVMTAEGGIEGAVEAIRAGAADYLPKPVEVDDLALRMLRARRDRQARRGAEHKRAGEAAQEQGFFFGRSLTGVQALLEKIVAADRRLQPGAPPPPVLIEGETGTGKTTLARWIHHRGPRAEGPLVEVNCSALPETLAESELFGHERGAFTDAKEARIGLLEAAEGGTLFLDELPSLSPAVQAKLLTAIEDRAIRRVGGNRTVRVDVRLIAATHADLRGLVAAGRFREDLMHRLDLFRVSIPPLRARGAEDIAALATTLAAGIARRYGLPQPGIPAVGRARLAAQRWTGNVRELAHAIERALVFDDDGLTFASLAASGGSDGAEGEAEGSVPVSAWLSESFRFPEDGGFSLDGAANAMVRRALAQAGGNVSAAARLLGTTRDTVRYRMKQMRIGDADPAGE